MGYLTRGPSVFGFFLLALVGTIGSTPDIVAFELTFERKALIAVHHETQFDRFSMTARELDGLVDRFQRAHAPVFFLTTSPQLFAHPLFELTLNHWVGGNVHYGVAIESRSGEHDLRLPGFELVLTGGYLEGCWGVALADAIENFFADNPAQRLVVHLPSAAIFSAQFSGWDFHQQPIGGLTLLDLIQKFGLDEAIRRVATKVMKMTEHDQLLHPHPGRQGLSPNIYNLRFFWNGERVNFEAGTGTRQGDIYIWPAFL